MKVVTNFFRDNALTLIAGVFVLVGGWFEFQAYGKEIETLQKEVKELSISIKEKNEKIINLVNTNKLQNIVERDKISNNEKIKHDKLEKDIKEFFQAEINGLRSDGDRRFIEVIDFRLKKLEK